MPPPFAPPPGPNQPGAYQPGGYQPGPYHPGPGAGGQPAVPPWLATVPPTKAGGSRTLVIVLVAVGLALVLLIGGCAALITWGVRTATAPVDAANRWLDAIEDGRNDDADELTCDGLRSELDELETELDRRGWTGGQNLSESEAVNRSATVRGTLELRSDDTAVTVHLGREGHGFKGWCVSGFSFGR